jgi:hypothetical protein
MKQTVFEVTRTTLAMASGSCLISMMALFMGGGQSGTDLRALMYLQAALTPVAIVIVAITIYSFVSSDGWAKGMRAVWRALPQWMIFIFLLLNSLVLFGELAFVIVMAATDEIVLWHQHVPLAAMFCCSSAYLLLYARQHSYTGSEPAMSGRWT